MPAAARLNEIVDALEMQFDGATSFLDSETGKVETVSNDLLSEAEEPGDGIWIWQNGKPRNGKLQSRLFPHAAFCGFPSKFDVHEWAIMEEFSNSVRSETIREDLLHAIHGAGAFRHFKHNIRRHGIEQSWFKVRTEAMRDIAIEWCEQNKIPWE